MVRPNSRVGAVAQNAIRQGINLVVEAGGERVAITTAEGSRRLPAVR